MKICIISDTHNLHKRFVLPQADAIIHCGDMTPLGRVHELTNFFKWFSSLNQYKYRICIAGNHDFLFETNSYLAKSLVPSNVFYLEDNGIELDGLYFYGTPVSKPFYDWAFNRPEELLKQYWAMIPDNTDVLITHTPPYQILDYVPFKNTNEGSATLRTEVLERIKPKIHCFGHLHESHGITEIDGIKFINAALLNDNYLPTYEPIVVEI